MTFRFLVKLALFLSVICCTMATPPRTTVAAMGVRSATPASQDLLPLQFTFQGGQGDCDAEAFAVADRWSRIPGLGSFLWVVSDHASLEDDERRTGCGVDGGVGASNGAYSENPPGVSLGSLVLATGVSGGASANFGYADVGVDGGGTISVFNPNPFDVELRVTLDESAYVATSNNILGFYGRSSINSLAGAGLSVGGLGSLSANGELLLHQEVGPEGCSLHKQRAFSQWPSVPGPDPLLDSPVGGQGDATNSDLPPSDPSCQAQRQHNIVPANSSLSLSLSGCGLGLDSEARTSVTFDDNGNPILRSGYGIASAYQRCEVATGPAVPPTGAATLEITAHSPIDLLLTDPLGRRVGFDLVAKQVIDNVPGARFTGHATEPETIAIPFPATGDYGVELLGIGNGPYGLTIRTLDSQGNELDRQDTTGTITSGTQLTAQAHVSANGRLGTADTTPPTTTALAAPGSNAAGWNNTNVMVTLNAVDNSGGSGVKEIHYSLDGAQSGNTVVAGSSASVQISMEGSTTLTYFAVDNAGNQESPSTLLVRVDKTPPIITGTRAPAANVNGWNNTPVTVSFQCTDALSGLSAGSPGPPIVLSTEGSAQQVTGVCMDLAGNVASATVQGINIDLTPPSVTAIRTPAPNANGWNNSPVSITFVASDGLSGVATVTPPVIVSTDGAGQVVTGTATDNAGNIASTQAVVNLDQTPPEVYFEFDAAAQDVVFMGRDQLSGVAPGPIPPIAVSSARDGDPDHGSNHEQGDDHELNQREMRTYRAFDLAGNRTTTIVQVRRNRHELTMSIVSLQYGSGPVITFARNSERFGWTFDDDGLVELDQRIELGTGEEAPRITAHFNLWRNETIIEQVEPEPKTRLVASGLVLMRLATSRGALSIEY